MDDLISKYIPKSAPSEHPWNLAKGIVVVIFIIAFLMIGVITSKSYFLKLVCLLLMGIVIIAPLYFTRQVEFKDFIYVKPIWGSVKTFEYSKIESFEKHYDGQNGMIWVITFQGKKKVTFYDENLDYEEFKMVLNKLKNEHIVKRKGVLLRLK